MRLVFCFFFPPREYRCEASPRCVWETTQALEGDKSFLHGFFNCVSQSGSKCSKHDCAVWERFIRQFKRLGGINLQRSLASKMLSFCEGTSRWLTAREDDFIFPFDCQPATMRLKLIASLPNGEVNQKQCVQCSWNNRETREKACGVALFF